MEYIYIERERERDRQIDTQTLQYSKMNIKSHNIRQITLLNTNAHIKTCQSVLGVLMHILAA